jgi:3-isopropylmalate/(R)-2-methylmalate dehydratase small subunit
LPVVVSDEMLSAIFKAAEVDPTMEVDIDLPAQTIQIVGTDLKESFEIAPYKKQCLMSGYDDVDFLVSIREEIESFEKR